MPAIIQLVETEDRIFNPTTIRRAGLTTTGLEVVFCGGHQWNIPESENAYTMYESLKNSGLFIEHGRELINPSVISNVVKSAIDNSIVHLFYLDGSGAIVRGGDALGLYEKFRQHMLACNQFLAAQQQAEQQAAHRAILGDPALRQAIIHSKRKN